MISQDESEDFNDSTTSLIDTSFTDESSSVENSSEENSSFVSFQRDQEALLSRFSKLTEFVSSIRKVSLSPAHYRSKEPRSKEPTLKEMSPLRSNLEVSKKQHLAKTRAETPTRHDNAVDDDPIIKEILEEVRENSEKRYNFLAGFVNRIVFEKVRDEASYVYRFRKTSNSQVGGKKNMQASTSQQEGEIGLIQANSCIVCRDDYKFGEKIRRLPCFHQFHMKCIDLKFKLRFECPICKVCPYLVGKEMGLEISEIDDSMWVLLPFKNEF